VSILTDQALFLVLGPCPSITIRLAENTDQLVLDGTRYALLERDMGFYDFLRNRERAIIGLRFSFFSKQRLFKSVETLDYVYVDEKRQYIEIYLQGYRGSAVQEPGEQAFGDDALWRSDLGIYALQVGTDELIDVELQALREYVPSGG
jgi:hypothetical protein